MSKPKKNSFNYGGQAVIEGVMMRGPNHFSVACRRENQEVVISTEPIEKSILGRLKWLNKPFLRGTLAMIDTMVLGMKALMFSANIAMEDAEVADAAEKNKKRAENEAPLVEQDAAPKKKAVNDIALGATIFLGLGIGVVLFMLLPVALTIQLKKVSVDHRIWLGLTEGGIKIVLFVGYVWLISRMRDIRRVFEYHGAEHKIISVHEAGEELTVENANKHSTVHVRCGTSFLLVVLVTSILIFSLIPWETIFQRFVLKLALLPVVAGIAYEIIKFAGKRKESALLRVILWPGLLMQKLTTQQPSPDQIEIAITALKSVMAQEEDGREPAPQPVAQHHH